MQAGNLCPAEENFVAQTQRHPEPVLQNGITCSPINDRGLSK